MPAQTFNLNQQVLLKFFTKSVPAFFLALALFGGGILLLSLRIPGWSLILGLPSVQLGIIFLIFTFDDVVRRKVGIDSIHLTTCSICRNPIAIPEGQKEKICEVCRDTLH